MKAAMEANFWGPVRVIRGVLPCMRAKKAGTIVSISSIFGFQACPALAMYCVPKAAQDILQLVLKAELAMFNIRPITITAGLYRTNVFTNSKQPVNGFGNTYMAGSLGKTITDSVKMAEDPTQIPGDPGKFGERIVDIVDCTGLGAGLEKTTRFLLGRDAIYLSGLRMAELREDFKSTEAIATSTDFEGHTGRGVGIIGDYL